MPWQSPVRSELDALGRSHIMQKQKKHGGRVRNRQFEEQEIGRWSAVRAKIKLLLWKMEKVCSDKQEWAVLVSSFMERMILK